MLTEKDQQIILALVDQMLLERLDPINDQAKVHLEFHKQLAERITRLEERIDSTRDQDISKT